MHNLYRNRRVLITGGLGFIGSNLAIRLAGLGASVTIVDALVKGCGGNLHNIAPVSDRVRVIRSNIGRAQSLRHAIAQADLIFNLAGEVSHTHSMRFPKRDALLNAGAHLSFLLECSRIAPGIRVVYAGTRQIYGVPQYLPVDERHPVCPVDFNGVHKYAAASYHLLLARTGKLDAVVLNLSNVYGPRMALSVPCQGFLANFVRKLLAGWQLEVFGDGRQLRDPIYSDDAVDALLAAGAAERLPSRVYNVGGPEPMEIGQIAAMASRFVGLPSPLIRPFPADRKIIDIGSYYADTGLIRRELRWIPRVKLEEGIERTLEFYRGEGSYYVDALEREPQCEFERAAAERRKFAASIIR